VHISLANIISSMTPVTRAYGLRRWAYRRAGVAVGEGAIIAGGVKIYGSNVSIGSGAMLGLGVVVISTPQSAVVIGPGAGIGPWSLITVGTHDLGGPGRRWGTDKSVPISIGGGAWLTSRCVVLAGTTVGPGAVVAAGSVCPGSQVGENEFWAGVPARFKKTIED
jgi:acetyltransferase-like isoleucine patch superfamily enzyme